MHEPIQEPESDEQLMEQIAQGNRQAFERFLTRYQQPILNFAWRMLKSESDAEDVAQLTFVQVWKSAHRFHASAKVTTWLFTITRNLCLNELRRRSRHPAESLDAESEELGGKTFEVPDPGARSGSTQAVQSELSEKVEEVIASLPESQREALLLCREDLSYDEIAQAIGTSIPAVKSLIFRAREVLKARLKPYLKTGAWGN